MTLARCLAAAALALAPLTLPVAVVAAPPAHGAADPALAEVIAHIRDTHTMTADFTQTDRTGRTLAGHLTLRRPGQVRFEYQKGVPVLIVADGRSLNMIDYEVRQVQRYPIGDSPLSALLDPDRDLARYARMIPTGNPDVLSVEVRDPHRPEYGVITMIFVRRAGAPGGLTLDGWVALDSQHNRTTVRLTGQKYNVPVSANAFRWTDPRASTHGGR